LDIQRREGREKERKEGEGGQEKER